MKPQSEISMTTTMSTAHTHKLRGGELTLPAWRYLISSPIPGWVARNFHNLGDGRRTHRSGYSVPEGDWILHLGAVATVLTDAEFQEHFEPL